VRWRRPSSSCWSRPTCAGVGAYHMAQAGLQVGSGFTVGLVGGFIGIHWALALSAFALIVADVGLLLFVRRGQKGRGSPSPPDAP